MQNYNYNDIENIQDKIYTKLLDYVDLFLDREDIVNTIDFFYPDFDEQKVDKAFSLWLISDYRTKYNKSFIEHMLDEYNNEFDLVEKEILMEQNNSYLSLYQIQSISGNDIAIRDLITNKDLVLTDPRSVNVLKENDIIYARVLNVLGTKKFSNYFSFLPINLKDEFLNKIILDFNRERMKDFKLGITAYLKQYSLNVYKIYTDLIYELIKLDEEKVSNIYNELDSFEGYMENYIPMERIREYSDNLVNFFEYYLIEKKLNIDDIPNIDFKYLLIKSIEQGYITSKEDFLSYANTFKYYFKYLKCKSKKFNKPYREVLNIYRDLFLYFEYINKIDHPFKVEQDFSRNIYRSLSEQAFNLVLNYDKFIMYVIDNPLRCSSSFIKENDILDMAYSITDPFDEDYIYREERDKPLFNLFYYFSLDSGIAQVKNNFFILTEKAAQFLKLKDEDKYTLLLKYLFSSSFKDKTTLKANLKGIFADLTLNSVNSFYDSSVLKENYENYRYLELFDLINIEDRMTVKIELSSFGKFIYKILYLNRNLENSGKVLFLNEYR